MSARTKLELVDWSICVALIVLVEIVDFHVHGWLLVLAQAAFFGGLFARGYVYRLASRYVALSDLATSEAAR